MVKSLCISPTVFHEGYISDEMYYVPVGGRLLQALGVVKDIAPVVYNVIPASFSFINGTAVVNATLGEGGGQVHTILLFGDSQRGTPFDVVVRPALPSLVYSVRWVAGFAVARLILMTIACTSTAVFSYVLYKRYGPAAPVIVAVVYAVDGVVFRLHYVMMLDSLMLSFLQLFAACLLSGKEKLSLVFLSLSAASKEVGAVFGIATAVYELASRKPRRAVAFLLAPAAALALSYLLNVLIAPADIVVYSMMYPPIVYDDVCRDLCLLGLYSSWGVFSLFTPFVWVWLPLSLFRWLARRGDDDPVLAVYLVSLCCILFVVLVNFVRSIYNFYYSPVVALLPAAISDIVVVVPQRGCSERNTFKV